MSRSLVGSVAGHSHPTFHWDFRSGALPPGATYTGSGGTTIGPTGLIAAATTNVPRFDYDPLTLSPLGYLAEMASTNLVLRSEAFDNASWTKTRSSISADAAVAPDGATTADKLVEDSANNTHHTSSNAIALTNVGVSASVFVKAAGRTACRIEFAGGAGTFGCSFNLATGVAGTPDAGTTATIRAFGNGWYRVSVQATWPSSSNANFFVFTQAVAGTSSYQGDGTSGIYVWGAQLETAGVGVTSYIPTAGSTASRTQNVLSLPLTSLPGWSASQGGVLVAAYRLHTIRPSGVQAAAGISDVAESNYVFLAPSSNGSRRWRMNSGGAAQFDLQAGTPPSVFVRDKSAGGWGTARGQLAANGAIVSTSSGAYTLPASPANLYIGASGSSDTLNGTLESIAYYRGGMPDAFVSGASYP